MAEKLSIKARERQNNTKENSKSRRKKGREGRTYQNKRNEHYKRRFEKVQTSPRENYKEN